MLIHYKCKYILSIARRLLIHPALHYVFWLLEKTCLLLLKLLCYENLYCAFCFVKNVIFVKFSNLFLTQFSISLECLAIFYSRNIWAKTRKDSKRICTWKRFFYGNFIIKTDNSLYIYVMLSAIKISD